MNGHKCPPPKFTMPLEKIIGGLGGDSIAYKKGTEKRTEKGPESQFATSICMNSEKEPGLYRFGPIFTKEISFLIQ